jgi:hypothetical protein
MARVLNVEMFDVRSCCMIVLRIACAKRVEWDV